jgi:hypothetical protein
MARLAWRNRQRREPGAAALVKPEQRHQAQLPREMRERQPFLLDVAGRVMAAPWPKGRELPGDDLRLLAVLDCIANSPLPGKVCWCWSDREPEPVKDAPPVWLAAWCRDRACYRLDPASQEAR